MQQSNNKEGIGKVGIAGRQFTWGEDNVSEYRVLDFRTMNLLPKEPGVYEAVRQVRVVSY